MTDAPAFGQQMLTPQGHAALYVALAAAGHDAAAVGLFTTVDGYEIRYPLAMEDAVNAALADPDFDANVLALRKSEMRSEILATRDAAMAAGFTADLADGTTVTLQTRETDRPHWLSALALYQSAIAAGNGGDLGATIRDAADESHVLSYAEAAGLIVAMGLHGAGIMAASWKAKDAVTSATSLAELDAISTVDPAIWATL